MIDNSILENIKTTLENLLRSIPESSHTQRINYISSMDKNEQTNQLAEILNLAQNLISNLKPSFHRTPEDKLEAAQYLRTHSKDDRDYQHYLRINSEYNYESDFAKLNNIKLIGESKSDKIRLAILTQFFDDLAHLRNDLANKSYEMKSILIRHFLKKYPNDSFAVPSYGRSNTDTAFFLYINDRFLSWHSQDSSILTSNLPEPFYIMAQRALSTLVEFKGKNFTLQEIKTIFLEKQPKDIRLQNDALQKILELNNIQVINTLVSEEREKTNPQEQQQENNTPKKTTKPDKKLSQKKAKSKDTITFPPEVDKLINCLETVECALSIEDLSTYIKDTNWGDFIGLSKGFSALHESPKTFTGMERIVMLACTIDNIIKSHPELKDVLGKYCDDLCHQVRESGIIVTSTRLNSNRYFLLNPSLSGKVIPDDGNPKIRIRLYSKKVFQDCTIREMNGKKLEEIKAIAFSKIMSSLFEEPKKRDEYIGGGTYEENTPSTNNNIDTNSNNLNDTSVCRDTAQLIEIASASNNPEIKKLLQLYVSKKVCGGFKISDIATMEILQTAFDTGIINSENFTNLQFEALNTIISNAKIKSRIEIKSCGKNSKKEDSAKGKFLVLRAFPNPIQQPIYYKLSDELEAKLINSYPEIQLTQGRALQSIENLSVLEKISGNQKNNIPTSQNKPERNTPEIETAESSTTTHINEQTEVQENTTTPTTVSPLFTAKDLDEFLNQPESIEKLRSAIKESSPELKALLAAIIAQLVPGSISPINKENRSNRNGGLEHE